MRQSLNLVRHTSIALLVISSLIPSAVAQFVQQGSKLVGTGAIGNAAQGRTVALSADGNTAMVSGPSDNNNVGAAWVKVDPIVKTIFRPQ